MVVLAAGMGTRFGGLKQLEPVTPEGETILDFSIYDALRCGVSRLVFVVRREILGEFRTAFESKPGRFASISYVCQDECGPPRAKPWGTGHAVLSAGLEVKDNFLVINADDFYGRAAFETMTSRELSPSDPEFLLAGYELKNTLSDNGAVSRGECVIDSDGLLETLLERKGVLRDNSGIYSSDGHRMPPDTTVSMNLWAFTPRVFDILGRRFARFAESADGAAEFYLNEALSDAVAQNEARIRVLKTGGQWAGVTFPGDKAGVAALLSRLKREGIYPGRLW